MFFALLQEVLKKVVKLLNPKLAYWFEMEACVEIRICLELEMSRNWKPGTSGSVRKTMLKRYWNDLKWHIAKQCSILWTNNYKKPTSMTVQ